MKVVLELAVISMLMFAGWRQPFRDHFRAAFPKMKIAPSRVATAAQPHAATVSAPVASAPAATPLPRDSSWKWQPSTLDPPDPRKR